MISTESIHGDETAENWMDLKLPRSICIDFARDHRSYDRTKISMIHNQDHRLDNILKRRTNFVSDAETQSESSLPNAGLHWLHFATTLHEL
jgi:hypothetical protein